MSGPTPERIAELIDYYTAMHPDLRNGAADSLGRRLGEAMAGAANVMTEAEYQRCQVQAAEYVNRKGVQNVLARIRLMAAFIEGATAEKESR